MSMLELSVFATVITVLLYLLVTLILPALALLAQQANVWVEGSITAYQTAWLWKTEAMNYQAEQRKRTQEFLAWLEQRAGLGQFSDQVDADVLEAQRLTPLIRCLIQEEIPAAIKRCNSLHRKLAIATGAVHMGEIASEPECVLLRQSVVRLLANSLLLLDQYPLSLRIEADELLNATIALRKGLLPTCRRCPYIQSTVAAAGPHCPASKLIQIKGN